MTNAIQMIADNTFAVEARGVAYNLRKDTLGRWEVHSRRLALGSLRHNIGSFRFFSNLSEVSAAVKAFRGIDLLAA